MKTYSEFRPTEFDSAGAFINAERGNWMVVPVNRNRDSGHLDQSNFEQALEMMGGEGDDVEVYRFGHWGPGWFEIALVRPGSAAHGKAEAIEARLSNYAILNEDDVSTREHDAYSEAWDSWGASEFVRELVKKFGLDEGGEELLEEADKEKLKEFFEACVPSGDYAEDGAPVVRRAIESATLEQVEAFLDTLEQVPSPSAP